ncbi:hypothetical protein DPMN_088766 [Dreissena polymorpha]|uniref:Uncharacterized protein n=1 Tax=Dreissena polymorpha TaxID=45954 RepID=A0A9D4QY66_DREPO|nr:hypothetical protein DPMN_088766 [Dreissena polymorpha]
MAESISSRLSIQLDEFLNSLGFNEIAINERICLFDKCTIATNLSARNIQKRNDIDRMFVGSQREGIGLSFINDTDVLQTLTSCICLESTNISHQTIKRKVLFYLDCTRTYPGHYLLKAQPTHEAFCVHDDIQNAIVRRFGAQFLSADKFMSKNDDMFATSNGYIAKCTVFFEKKRPFLAKNC